MGPGNHSLRGDPGQWDELLRRMAAPGRVHLEAPVALRDGGNIQGRPGDPSVHVRARVRRLLRRAGADDPIARLNRRATVIESPLPEWERAGERVIYKKR